MKRKTLAGVLIILVIIVAGGLLISRKRSPSPGVKPEESSGGSSGVANVVEANNQFAFEYYSHLKNRETGNIFFSPFSISSALVMTYEGAREQTAKEMQSVLHFPADDNLRRTEYLKIFNELNKKDKKYELNIANALWAQKDYQFLSDYIDTVEKYYGGKTNNLDFVKDPEGSRVTINDWVEKQTKDKIKDLIPQGVINDMTRLVLTNAIYFKGEWVKQFDKENTTDEDFRINENDSVKVPMMQRTDEEAEFNYAENKDLQILEMPYSGEDLSMLILLPKDDDLAKVENSLSIENLAQWKKDLKKQRVEVFVPKFKFETKYLMTEDLKAMGMPTAFGLGADFSGMDGKKDLFISEVIHQAFVEVNEEGTEAAAATGVVMMLGALPGEETKIPVFRADHPFIFLIQEKNSGNILFIGRVVNPAL
jgi:serpin B